MITVKAFCQKYNVTHQTVYTKIKRKRQALKDHIFQKDNIMMLDEYAETLLKPCRPEAEFEEKILFLKIQLSEKNEKIKNLTEEVNYKKNKISQLEREIENAKNEIFQLNQKLDSFENVQITVDNSSTEKKKNVFGKLGNIIGKK